LAVSSATTLLAILALYVGSPLAAEAYRARGVAASERGEYSQAIRAFRQALSLDPQQARSHYNLASAYEALYEFDIAITEYQLALQSDETFWPTYNNLGRLLITQRADPHAALAVLLDGYRRADSQLGQAVIGKNLAWAYLELEYYSTALRTIDQVLVQLQDLRNQGEPADAYLAEVYMLRARILAASSNQQAALLAWQDSLGYALAVSESQACTAAVERLPQTCIDALRWVAAAREQIQVLSGGE
jgi:tetratricopeptide (TPR) repeat protein